MKSKNFENGIETVHKKLKPYYHGSATELTGNSLHPRRQYTHKMDARVNAVFVTPDIEYAKLFAMRKCISGNGKIRIIYNEKTDKKKMYFEKLSDNITPYFYIYSVLESAESPFIHDSGSEYYSLTHVKIINKQKHSLVKELLKSKCEIYVMDEPLNDGPIGKHHRIDIKDIISHQSGNGIINTLKTITDFVRY